LHCPMAETILAKFRDQIMGIIDGAANSDLSQ
jgi:hypothetical protein